jgi:hypothetical protein
MARVLRVELIDDLDGGQADETVRFSLDGLAYQIDLSALHARQLRESVAAFTSAARARTTADRAQPWARTPRRSGGRRRERNRAIREWARQQGVPLPVRGRIPDQVKRAYPGERTLVDPAASTDARSVAPGRGTMMRSGCGGSSRSTVVTVSGSIDTDEAGALLFPAPCLKRQTVPGHPEHGS